MGMTEYTKRGRNRKGGILGIRRDTPLVSDRRGRYGAGSNFRDLHASPRSHFFSSFQTNRLQHLNSFFSQKKPPSNPNTSKNYYVPKLGVGWYVRRCNLHDSVCHPQPSSTRCSTSSNADHLYKNIPSPAYSSTR